MKKTDSFAAFFLCNHAPIIDNAAQSVKGSIWAI